MSNKIKIGWSEVDITPKQKISLDGQFFDRITDVVESPITVTGFALESGDEQMIICSCDLVAVTYELTVMAREILKDKLPISPDKVIVTCIHDHTSYTYTRRKRLPGSSDDIIAKYMPKDVSYVSNVQQTDAMDPDEALEFLSLKIAEAAELAWANRKEAYYANAFGRAVVGFCRRVVYNDGSAKMWGETNNKDFDHMEAGNDTGIEMMFTFDENKQLSGVVANVACPAQVVEHRNFISSDYWGKVKENLRAKYGENLKVLGLCSAAGDQAPRDLIRFTPGETPTNDPNIEHEYDVPRRADPSMFDISGLRLAGKRVANEISAVFEEGNFEILNEGVLKHEVVTLDMPVRRVPKEEYEFSDAFLKDFFKKNGNKDFTFEEEAKLFLYAGTIARYEIQDEYKFVPEEVHFIRFNDVAFATNPYELFLDYGNKIRALSKAKQTFLIQLACGAEGYLPTEIAEKGGHYSAYVTSGIAGHEGGNYLVDESVKHINKMFE